jgi:hypothetical protein
MCSCYDHELHEVLTFASIHNQTQHNIHVLYDKKDFSLSDSIYYLELKWRDSLKVTDSYPTVRLDTTLRNQDNPWKTTEFVDFLSKFKVFYIEKGDTFKVSEKFYDGISYWKTESHREMDGIMFIHYYWWVEYTATLTDEMFEKK